MCLLITFDLDGVLQQNPFGKGVFPEVCGKIGETLVSREGLTVDEAAKTVMTMIRDEAKRRLTSRDYVGAYDWDDIVLVAAKAAGSPARFDVEQLVVKYCTPDYIFPYPYAFEVLSELSGLGVRLAVVTNGFYKYQNPVMEGIGLRHFFPDFITPEMVGTVKPFSGIFQAAIRGEYSLRLHVGDTIIHDVWGAQMSGFDPIWMVKERDLPEHLLTLAPWERPHRPEIRPVIAKAFDADLHPGAYPDVTADDCRPAYVITDLREILAVVEYAKEAVA